MKSLTSTNYLHPSKEKVSDLKYLWALSRNATHCLPLHAATTTIGNKINHTLVVLWRNADAQRGLNTHRRFRIFFLHSTIPREEQEEVFSEPPSGQFRLCQPEIAIVNRGLEVFYAAFSTNACSAVLFLLLHLVVCNVLICIYFL